MQERNTKRCCCINRLLKHQLFGFVWVLIIGSCRIVHFIGINIPSSFDMFLSGYTIGNISRVIEDWPHLAIDFVSSN